MKIRRIVMIMILGMGITASVYGMNITTQAKVTASLKGTTLTIKGKGKMPDSMTYANNKKIKKVRIKKGVTSVPKSAFAGCKNLKSISFASTVRKIGQECMSNCKKLKKIKMPGNFKLNTGAGEEGYESINNYTVESVTFVTNLNPKVVSYISTNKLIVKKNDKKFASFDGVVYTKDGKELVRVPSGSASLTVRDGCETVYTDAINYCGTDGGGDPINGIGGLESLVLPKSVKKVACDRYHLGHSVQTMIENLCVKNPYLDGRSITCLSNEFMEISMKQLMKMFPTQIKKVGNMYISSDKLLIKYEGEEEHVIIPDDVTEIGDSAFADTGIVTVKIPNSVKAIGRYAFLGSDLAKISIPSSVRIISMYAFDECRELRKIKLAEGIEKIEIGAFNETAWKELVLPSTLKKIEESAFCNASGRKVTIKGNSENYALNAFAESASYKFSYKGEVKNYRVFPFVSHRGAYKNGKREFGLSWYPIKQADGYQIQFSTTKNYKKNVGTVYAKGKEKHKVFYAKNKKQKEYIRIRPYKVVKGEKEYGRWSELTY